MRRIIAGFLVLALISPVLAIDVSSFGLNIPSIQGAGLSDQTAGKSTVEMVLESPIDEESYRLGPGDVLAVHLVIGDSDIFIDQTLNIGPDGKAFFPKIGPIYLSGISLKESKDKINAAIRNIYHENYQLYVLLSQPKKIKIYVTGMVQNPGPLSVFDNLRVSEILGLAGGIASGASNRFIYIIRKDEAGQTKILKADLFEAFRGRDLSKDIRVQSGDIIEVPDANNERISQLSVETSNNKLLLQGKETFVYIYGEVARSGRFEYVPGRKLSDYISFAGGPTAKALLNSVTVTRQVNGKSEKIAVNVADVLYNGKAENDLEISGGDVINVPGNFFYVADFTSFVNTVLLALTVYVTARR